MLEGEWTTDERPDYDSLKLDVTSGNVGSEDIILSPTVQLSGVLLDIPPDVNVTGLRLEGIDGPLGDIKTPIINSSFNIANVHSGEYTMIVDGIPNGCVERSRVGDEDQEGPRVTVKVGEDSILLTAIAKYNTFPIQGSVKDHDIGRANFEVIAQGEDSERLYETQSNAEGHFIFPNVCPGRYRLYSWPSNSVEYRDPLTLLRYKIDSTEVSVSSWNLVNNVELSPMKVTRN